MQTAIEQEVRKNVEHIFNDCPDSVATKLENFPKYVRRQYLNRFLVLYELFKMVMAIKGSIVECGVFKGFGLMSWAKLSTMLEPENIMRRIYGFDSFEGFPGISDKDTNSVDNPVQGGLRADSYEELQKLIVEYDHDRFLGHVDKVHLIKGDATKTIPEFISENTHLVVSLLFLDFDLYEPTKIAIESFLPRMSKGAVIAFDELDSPIWPGETMALMDSMGLNNLELRRFAFDPFISFIVLD